MMNKKKVGVWGCGGYFDPVRIENIIYIFLFFLFLSRIEVFVPPHPHTPTFLQVHIIIIICFILCDIVVCRNIVLKYQY